MAERWWVNGSVDDANASELRPVDRSPTYLLRFESWMDRRRFLEDLSAGGALVQRSGDKREPWRKK